MKKIAALFLIVMLCGLALSCNKNRDKTIIRPAKSLHNNATNLNKAKWFLGSWHNTTKQGKMIEFWVKANDSVYQGESYFIVGKDTVFAEHMQLEEVHGKMAYIVTIPNQNQEQSVRFEMTNITEKCIIFENPKHDFPNKIMYSKITNDSIVAVIYGVKDGKSASETFAMARHK